MANRPWRLLVWSKTGKYRSLSEDPLDFASGRSAILSAGSFSWCAAARTKKLHGRDSPRDSEPRSKRGADGNGVDFAVRCCFLRRRHSSAAGSVWDRWLFAWPPSAFLVSMLVHSQPAHQRNRRAHGAGCGPARCGAVDSEARDASHRDRHACCGLALS